MANLLTPRSRIDLSIMKSFLKNTAILLLFCLCYTFSEAAYKRFVKHTIEQYISDYPGTGSIEYTNPQDFLASLPDQDSRELFISLQNYGWLVIVFQITLIPIFGFIFTRVNNQREQSSLEEK